MNVRQLLEKRAGKDYPAQGEEVPTRAHKALSKMYAEGNPKNLKRDTDAQRKELEGKDPVDMTKKDVKNLKYLKSIEKVSSTIKILAKIAMDNPAEEKTNVNTVADLLGQSGSKKMQEPAKESPKSESTDLNPKEVSDK